MEESKNTSPIGGEKMCGGKTCACNSAVCSCGCGCGWARGHRLFRVVLGVVILLVMFWIGVKVGEFKAMVEGYGGYGSRYAYPVESYSTGGMMQGNRVVTPSVTGPTSAPSASSATPAPLQR